MHWLVKGWRGSPVDHILLRWCRPALRSLIEEWWIDGLEFLGGLVGRFVVVTHPLSKWKRGLPCRGLHHWLLSNLGLSHGCLDLVAVVPGLALACQPQVSSLGSHILSSATWSGSWRWSDSCVCKYISYIQHSHMMERWYTLDKVSANTASSVPKTSKF